MRDPLINYQLGPYRLTRVVGRGGMGSVYAAEDSEDKRPAAVKILSPLLASDESFRERFTAEIDSLKKLHHPNIVQLYGFGEQDGQLFYVMELIDGNSLHEELRRGRRFNWREVTRIAIDICAALKHAHDHGIIHRDLKPANLLYTREEEIRLLDFGIAKLFGSTDVTTNGVMGTADYMAPEQTEGKPVSPRTDLYSLGCVMYALLTGRPPFTGKSVPEVVHKVRFESPLPVGRFVSDVPLELEHFINQLLEKNPAKRVPTALAAAHRLKAMEHALSVQPTSSNDPEDELETSVTPTSPPEVTIQRTTGQPTVRMPADSHQPEDIAHLTVTASEEDVIESGPDHFTTVSTAWPAGGVAGVSWENAARFGILTLLLALLGFLGWVLSRPPTADQLIARLNPGDEAGASRSLLDSEKDVERFLQLYPQDPRAAEVKSLRDEIEVLRLQRRLETKAQRRGVAKSYVEQLYLDAVRQLPQDPASAQQRLQALLDLFDGANPPSALPERPADDDQQILEVARRQLREIEILVAARNAEMRSLLESRLQYAKQVAATDRDRAVRIYKAILELTTNQTSLADLRQQAEASLGELQPLDTVQSPTGN